MFQLSLGSRMGFGGTKVKKRENGRAGILAEARA